jgi:hypothetical protein
MVLVLSVTATVGFVTLVGLAGGDLWPLTSMMTKISYSGYRFPAAIIQQAIWLYARFTLSFRDVEDLLAERDRGLLRDGAPLGERFWICDCNRSPQTPPQASFHMAS